jgi:hypothetical protein
VADHVVAHVSEHKKIRDYRVHHCEKLHELRVNLEIAVNEIGMCCLSYPGKSSTIGEIVEWFNKEIQALPSVIFKANKKNSYATALLVSWRCCMRMQSVVMLRGWRLS